MVWGLRIAFGIFAAILLFVLALARGAYVSDAYFWTKLSDDAGFSPRDTSVGFTSNEWLYLSNGYGKDTRPVRDLWRSKDGAQWERVNASTSYDPYSHVFAREDSITAVLDNCWSSRDGGRTWEQIAANVGFGFRSLGSATTLGADTVVQELDEVWKSDGECRWHLATHAPFGKRYAGRLIEFRGQLLYVAGARMVASSGEHYDDLAGSAEVWGSPDGVKWVQLTPDPGWGPRLWPAVAADLDRIWLFGGYDNARHANLAGLWSSADGVEWQQAVVSTREPEARHGSTAFVTSEGFLLVAGNNWPLLNDVWLYRRPPLKDVDEFLVLHEADVRELVGWAIRYVH